MIDKYRQREEIITYAIIFENNNWDEIKKWLDEIHGGKYTVPIGEVPAVYRVSPKRLKIDTKFGGKVAYEGDVIIYNGIYFDIFPRDDFHNVYELI